MENTSCEAKLNILHVLDAVIEYDSALLLAPAWWARKRNQGSHFQNNPLYFQICHLNEKSAAGSAWKYLAFQCRPPHLNRRLYCFYFLQWRSNAAVPSQPPVYFCQSRSIWYSMALTPPRSWVWFTGNGKLQLGYQKSLWRRASDKYI